jgi:hypothetical protein
MILQAVKFNPSRGGHGWVRSLCSTGGSRWILPMLILNVYSTALKASVIQPQSYELTREPPALSFCYITRLSQCEEEGSLLVQMISICHHGLRVRVEGVGTLWIQPLGFPSPNNCPPGFSAYMLYRIYSMRSSVTIFRVLCFLFRCKSTFL